MMTLEFDISEDLVHSCGQLTGWQIFQNHVLRQQTSMLNLISLRYVRHRKRFVRICEQEKGVQKFLDLSAKASLLDIHTRSSFASSSTALSLPSSTSSSSPSVPSCEALYFRLAFLLLLAFFFLLISVFNAVLLSDPFSAASTFSASRRLAIFRFCDRDLVACDLITMPVGRCFSWTADDDLF